MEANSKQKKINKLQTKNIKLVITTINGANQAIKAYAKKFKNFSKNLIIIGDKKTPEFDKSKYPNFLNLQAQRKLDFKIIKKLPLNSYSRKNIGYLFSMKNNEVILETDDDNIPYDNFFKNISKKRKSLLIKKNGWVNVYKYFHKSDDLIWPRGFPLNKVMNNEKKTKVKVNENFYIQQRLADKNPDVDAIYRLINKKLNITFEKNKHIALNTKSFCPFNSQNTIWFKEAFPLLYLPTHCTMRSTDIWRSIVTQAITSKLGWKILFSSSTVFQNRNIHDLIKDFEQEIPVYRDVEKINDILKEVRIYKNRKFILVNLFNCYKKLVEKKIFNKKELEILKSWCYDVSSINQNLTRIK